MAGSLLFDDSIEIHDPDGYASGGSYWFETLADGASFGDPQPVDVIVSTLIRYGAIVTTTGADNREPSFLIRVTGADSGSLNEGIQALHAATRKATTLVWTPPDDLTEPLAWDVQTSALYEANGFDDLALSLRNQQVFRLAIKALPYRRSLTLTVDDAGTPPSSSGTVLYACESTTGWSSMADPFGVSSFAVDSTIYSQGTGSIKSRVVQWDQGFDSHTAYGASNDQVTGLSLSTGSGGYMAVDIRGESANSTTLQQLWTQIGGSWVEVDTFLAASRTEEGFVRYVWQVEAGLTVTGFRFLVYQAREAQFVARPYTWYDNVQLLPSATTDHQIVKQLDVAGSAPTPASLRVAAASAVTALGNVLVATVPTSEIPAGAMPDGRRWIVQGTQTTDTTALHGSYLSPDVDYSAATGPTDRPVFDVPATMLTGKAYSIFALVKAEGASTNFGMQAQSRIGSTDIGKTAATEATPLTPNSGWQFIGVGTINLPPTPLPGASDDAKVRLLFKGAKFADVYLIPAWEKNGWPVASVSIANCGTGTVGPGLASSSLWIDSPSLLNEGRGGYSRGPTADGLNAQSAFGDDMPLPGVHFFDPGSLTAWLVSTDAPGPTLQLSYYARYL